MLATFHNRYSSLPTTAGTRYNTFFANASSSWSGTETPQPVSTAATIKSLYLTFPAAVTGTMVHVITLRKNGVDTALTVTTDNSNTVFTDLVHTVSVSQGDELSWGIVTSGSGGSAAFVRIGFEMETSSGSLVATGSSSSLSAVAARYLSLQAGILSTTIGNAESIIPTGGTISNAYATLGGSPGVGRSYTAVLVKNGVDTALSVTIADSNTIGNDTANSVSVVAGDKVYWKITPSGSPSARMIQIGVRWTPTIDGEYIHMGVSTAPSASTAQYQAAGNSTFGSAQQRGGSIPTSDYTIKNLYVDLDSAPASGKSIEFTMMSNNSATSVTTTISNTATSGNDAANTGTTVAGGLVELRSTPTGTPTVSITRYAWVEYQLPASSSNSNFLMFM